MVVMVSLRSGLIPTINNYVSIVNSGVSVRYNRRFGTSAGTEKIENKKYFQGLNSCPLSNLSLTAAHSFSLIVLARSCYMDRSDPAGLINYQCPAAACILFGTDRRSTVCSSARHNVTSPTRSLAN